MFWEFLIKLVDSGQYFILTIIFTTIFVIISLSLAFIYKVLGKVHFKKLKIGGNEIEMSDSAKQNELMLSTINHQDSDHDIPTLLSTFQQIIDYSVENGNQASLKRQQLYEAQMTYIKSKFESIRIMIEFEYNNILSGSHPIVSVLLKNCFDTAIISKLEYVCRADKLMERTKEKLVEEQRILIDGAYVSVVNELKKYVSKTESGTDSLSITYVDGRIFELIEKRKVEISHSVTECLEHSWDEASHYFDELKEVRKQLSNNVTNALKSFFDSRQHEQIPTTWYDYDKLPPNEVVGVTL